VDVFDVRIASPVKMHQVATQVVRFMNPRQVLVPFMEGMLWKYEVRQQNRSDDFDLRSVSSEPFLKRDSSVWCQFGNRLAPGLEDDVFLFLDFEETFRLLGMPEKVIKHFISVVVRRKYAHFSDMEADIQSVQYINTLKIRTVEISQN
jgi:hypothetical protein